MLEKGWAQVAAALGVLFAGAAYLPIDPETPRERLALLLANGEVRTVLTSAALDVALDWPAGIARIVVDGLSPSGRPVHPVERRQQADDLAYVIYTSGSTGMPKGVMIDHRGAVNTLLDINSRFNVRPGERMLALSNLHFDLSVYDIFGILAAGAALVVPDPEKRREPSHWAALAACHGVTIWNSVPALMQMFVEYLESHAAVVPLRLALLSGDWIPLDLPGRMGVLFPSCQTVSLGGATEASIWSVLHPVERVDPEWKSIPYGRAMQNQRVRVLNAFLDECPDGVPGAICIQGAGLAQGYWKDAAKTAAAFPIHPKTGERLYRTGDLGCYLPDGSLRILGREDFQVKINGHRVELGEIEACLRQQKGIREAVVLLDGSRGGAKLRAFLALAPGTSFRPDAVRERLAAILPPYMIPSVLTLLEAFPLTANGKVDRNLLQAMKPAEGESPAAETPRQTEMETRVAAIIGDVAHIDVVDVQENFFDLGVDSLQLVRIQTRMEQEFAAHVAIVDFFKFPTVRSLSGHISGGEGHVREAERRSRSETRSLRRRRRAGGKAC